MHTARSRPRMLFAVGGADPSRADITPRPSAVPSRHFGQSHPVMLRACEVLGCTARLPSHCASCAALHQNGLVDLCCPIPVTPPCPALPPCHPAPPEARQPQLPCHAVNPCLPVTQRCPVPLSPCAAMLLGQPVQVQMQALMTSSSLRWGLGCNKCTANPTTSTCTPCVPVPATLTVSSS